MARIVTASRAGRSYTSTYCSILYSTECSLRLRANSTFFSAFRSMCGLHGRSKYQGSAPHVERHEHSAHGWSQSHKITRHTSVPALSSGTAVVMSWTCECHKTR